MKRSARTLPQVRWRRGPPGRDRSRRRARRSRGGGGSRRRRTGSRRSGARLRRRGGARHRAWCSWVHARRGDFTPALLWSPQARRGRPPRDGELPGSCRWTDGPRGLGNPMTGPVRGSTGLREPAGPAPAKEAGALPGLGARKRADLIDEGPRAGWDNPARGPRPSFGGLRQRELSRTRWIDPRSAPLPDADPQDSADPHQRAHQPPSQSREKWTRRRPRRLRRPTSHRQPS